MPTAASEPATMICRTAKFTDVRRSHVAVPARAMTFGPAGAGRVSSRAGLAMAAS
jgi:hypothetical protein